MKIAIEEHLKCTEFTRVGAVITKNGDLLSSGHRGQLEGLILVPGVDESETNRF